MSKKQKKNLIRIITAAVLMVVLHFIPASGWLRFCLYMIPYLLVGYDILIKAGKGIKNLQPLDECLLMVIATLGAIVIAVVDSGDYTEAVAVMLFYQIGEWFQSYAIDRSRRNISDLMDIRPDYANVRGENGKIVRVDPDEVEVGTIIICNPGEKVPIDGIVVSGKSNLDTVALTGESNPRSIETGDEIISGSLNMSGVIEIETTKEFGESTVSVILDLVENASSRKSKSEDFITKFARIYTPVVVIAALVLAFAPPLIRIMMNGDPLWSTWLYRALIFLVISCPCALVISIPLSFFAGIGSASRNGILIKGSNYLETLSNTKTMVFDKTGTLTEGVFKVVSVNPVRLGHEELIEVAAHAESASSHPISKSIIAEYGKDPDPSRVKDVEEHGGKGIRVKVDNHAVACGNERLMRGVGINPPEVNEAGTIIHIGVDGNYEGYIVISDVIKKTSREAIAALNDQGVSRIIMLTGDHKNVAESVGRELGIEEIESELLPADKVKIVEGLIDKENETEALAFVGDGINDAPVLSRADIGIAMGGIGSDAAIEAADVVLMDDDPLKISQAIRISRKCIGIVKQNIWFAIGVKIICLILGALGIANMWVAIFADVGVMVLAVLNALRALI